MSKIILVNQPIRWHCSCGHIKVDLPADESWVRADFPSACPKCGDRIQIDGAFEFRKKEPEAS